MNLSVKPAKVRAKMRLDNARYTVLHCSQDKGNKQKGSLCRLLNMHPCTDIIGKVQVKLSSAFSCSCTRELEEICFRARVMSSPLLATMP